MSKLLKLKKEFVEFLEDKPESGMGFHIVNVTKTTGKILEKRTVLNGTFLKLNEDEKLDNTKILKIEIA